MKVKFIKIVCLSSKGSSLVNINIFFLFFVQLRLLHHIHITFHPQLWNRLHPYISHWHLASVFNELFFPVGGIPKAGIHAIIRRCISIIWIFLLIFHSWVEFYPSGYNIIGRIERKRFIFPLTVILMTIFFLPVVPVVSHRLHIPHIIHICIFRIRTHICTISIVLMLIWKLPFH